MDEYWGTIGVVALVLIITVIKKKNLYQLIRSAPEYSSIQYWDERYRKYPATYEWYLSLDMLQARQILAANLLRIKGLRFLEIGCGNSRLAEEVYTCSGRLANIISIDFSDECIQQMKAKYPSRASNYIFMDARDMEFKNCSFDYVIDKGTLDAITNSLRDKSASVRVSISRTLQEIQRVLEPGGTFLHISCRPQSEWVQVFREAAPNLSLFSHTKLLVPSKRQDMIIHALMWKRDIKTEKT